MVSRQPCRLDDPRDCQTLIDLALGTYGTVDVLFNLAATSYFNWLEDITDEEWDRARWGEVDLVRGRWRNEGLVKLQRPFGWVGDLIAGLDHG
jgi:hypothetical protein